MIAIIDAILFILRTKNPTDFSWILALPLTLVCQFLFLSYIHISLKKGQQSLSTHILQIPKQTLSKVETCVCALTLEVTSILIACFTKTMSSCILLRYKETIMNVSNWIQPITIHLFTMFTALVWCYWSFLHPFSFLFWILLWLVHQELLRKDHKILFSAVSGLDLETFWYGL